MSNLHPVFEQELAPFMPPEDDGQEYQTCRPEPRDMIDHLRIGGYRVEADAFENVLNCLECMVREFDGAEWTPSTIDVIFAAKLAIQSVKQWRPA